MSSRLQNLTEAVAATGPKTSDQVISSLLKRKLPEDDSASQTVSLVQARGGHSLQVTVGKVTASKEQLLSADEFQKLQTNLHLSQKKTLKLAAALRVAAKSRNIVEPHLQEKLSHQIHLVDEFFSVENFELTVSKGIFLFYNIQQKLL